MNELLHRYAVDDIKMSSTKKKIGPVRLSEQLVFGKRLANSEKKKFEPVRVNLLELEGSGSTKKSARKVSDRRSAFVFHKKTVRRELYGSLKSPTPLQKEQKPTPKVSITPAVNPQGVNKPRKSLLPQPNSIVQRYIQSNTKSTPRPSTIIEERLSEVYETTQHQRPTVIKSAKVEIPPSNSQNELANETITIIPEVPSTDEDIQALNDDLEASLADKENIPPPPEAHQTQPLSENKLRQFDNIDNLYLVGLFRSSIMRMESLERSVEEMRSSILQMESLLPKVEELKTEVSKISESVQSNNAMMTTLMSRINVANSPLTSHVLSEISVPEKPCTSNKENTETSDKIRRKSKNSLTEPRRSLRLAIKETLDKSDSFLDLENQLNIYHSGRKTAPSTINVSKIANSRVRKKSERPLREYLALKATTSFLETPDAHSFKKNIPTADHTPSTLKSVRRSLSTKLFEELDDLYNDDSSTASPSGNDVA